MAAIAARYDTVMSWAMLGALLEVGISVERRDKLSLRSTDRLIYTFTQVKGVM
jgi:hypothetical protein